MTVYGTIFPLQRRFNVWLSMKIASLIFLLLMTYLPVYSQSNYAKIAGIDHLVQQIDKIADSSQNTFYLNKWMKNGDAYKETWHYTRKGEHVLVFHIRYTIDSIEYTEVYYLDRKRLIFSEEYETVYSMDDDQLKFARICHFSGLSLAQIVTLGRSSGYSPHFSAGYEILNKFYKRFRELEQNVQL